MDFNGIKFFQSVINNFLNCESLDSNSDLSNLLLSRSKILLLDPDINV